MRSATELAEAIRTGELSFESALEEALGDDYDGLLDDVFRTLGHFNLGERDGTVDLGDGPLTVAEFVNLYGLAPFLPLLDWQADFRFPLGEVVAYGDEAYRVIGRRATSPFATPRYDEYELLIEALNGGSVGFVGEGEVEPVDGDEPGGE